MRKGQAVECINDKDLYQIVKPIKKGNVYTIREFIKGYRPQGGNAPAVYLEEIENIIFLGYEIAYDANRFRKVDLSNEESKKSRTLEQVY
jgi:hypothetical protein